MTDVTTGIVPGARYTLAAFRRITGIPDTRMRIARRDGVDLPRHRIGKRAYVKGEDAIAYLDRLAELQAAKGAGDE